MRIIIHRGTHEIGGNCVELESGGKRILLDLGLPLEIDDDNATLPQVEGLQTGDDPTLLGVVISHPHQDHWGLIPRMSKKVPVFMGREACEILTKASFFMRRDFDIVPAGYLKHRTALSIGPFIIIPYLMDHSAYDAYSLLVEAGGKRIFYTGDFRAHGRKAKLFYELLEKPPEKVDVMLTEGTLVYSGRKYVRSARSEKQVLETCVPFFQKTPGIVLAVYSPMNIDRVVSLYKAANISKRLFVVDLYAAEILKTVRNTIPRPGHNWPDVKVFIPDYQRQMIKKYRAFDRINWVRNHRIFPNDLKSMKNIVIIFRERMAAELEKSDCLKGAGLLWSMWDGYLQKKPFWNEFASRHSMEIHHAHCSGHATITDIKRLVRAVNPRVIVPMHTQAPYKFKNMFSNVQVHEDREWWGAE